MSGPRFDLVAIDVDGTLLTSEKRLSREDADALRAAVARGVRIVLATARPPRGVRWILDEIGLTDAGAPVDAVTINYNGALVWDARSRREVEHTPLSGEVASGVVREAREFQPETLVSVEVVDIWHTDRHDPDLSMETGKLFAPDRVGPLGETLSMGVTKLMLLTRPERLPPLRRRVEDSFVRTARASVFVTDPHIVQIAAHGVDKGAALSRHAARLGVDPSRVMAIGDAGNDVEMLRLAGLGVAMANAERVAMDAADEVLGATNDEAGVAHALRRFGVV